MDLVNLKLDLAIRGTFGESGEVNLTLRDLTLHIQQSSGEYTFSADMLTPEVAEGIAGSHTISNLRGTIHPYVLTNGTSMTQVLVYQISFFIDTRYEVMAIDKDSYIFSQNTVTTPANGGSSYSTSLTQYEVDFVDTQKADVLIYNAKFVDNMPQISFKLQNIPVTLTETGYTLHIDEIIPVLSTSDTPATQYPISDFNLRMSGSEMNLRFNCTPTVSGLSGTYTVSSNGSVYPPQQNSY